MTALVPAPTPLERAIDGTAAARLGIPAAPITAAFSPERCPAALLGFLAWSLSIDLWDETWPEVKKRQVCARAFELHRLKGTLAGIRAHVALVDAELRGAVRPPARGFWRSAISEEARQAQLAALPQVRLYPFALKAIARRRWFLSSRAARRSYHSHAWVRRSIGPELLGTHATYWRAGIEAPIAVDEGAGEIRARLPATIPHVSWHGHGPVRGYLRASAGAANVVAFRPDPTRAAFALTRGADPVAIAPTRVYPIVTAPRHRSFFRRPLRWLQRSAGPRLVYDRFSIADPSVGIAARRVRTWHGHGRFGIRPFTAELQLVVPMQRKPLAFDRWHGRGFARTADFAPLARAVEAVRVSKAARDTVLLDTASHGPATFRAGARFGDPAFPSFGARMRNF